MDAGGYVEPGEVLGFQVRIAVRRVSRREPAPGWIARRELLLEDGTRFADSAGETQHFVQATMQVRDPSAAGFLMQAIHVLGDEMPDMAGGLDNGVSPYVRMRRHAAAS